jgi:hypothetical protein
VMRLLLAVCSLCSVLIWFSPAASAGQLFYDFSGGRLNTLTAIDTSTGAVVSTKTVTGGYYNLTGSAFDPSGAFYAIGQDATNNSVAISVNLFTGASTLLATLGESFMGMEVALDDTVYFGAGDSSTSELYSVSPDRSTFTDVGPMGFGNFMDFAIDSLGDLYAVASPYNDPPTGTSSIYEINTTTGLGTLVATVNVSCLMGIAFDSSNNLFATEFCGGPYPLYEINVTTGGATAIGSGTAFDVHGGDIDNFTPEPASLMLCLLGGALLAARGLRRAG